MHWKQTYQQEAMRAPEGHPRSTSQRWDTVRGDSLGCTDQNTRRGAQELGRRRPPGRIAPRLATASDVCTSGEQHGSEGPQMCG